MLHCFSSHSDVVVFVEVEGLFPGDESEGVLHNFFGRAYVPIPNFGIPWEGSAEVGGDGSSGVCVWWVSRSGDDGGVGNEERRSLLHEVVVDEGFSQVL